MPFNFKAGEPIGESAATLLALAVLPIAKVLVMCALGLAMATPYIGILTTSARKQLTKLVFSLFLPCLIFTQLGQAVTLQKILEWWFIPVNVIVASFLGCIIGYFVALVIRPPPQFFNFTVVMIGIGNIGNIPLVIIGAICRDKSNPFGDADQCNSDGVAYISFGQWVGAVIVYTFVYQMLAPPGTSYEVSDCESLDGLKSPKEELLNGHNRQQGCGNDDGLLPLLGENYREKMKQWTARVLAYVRIQDILQPPVVASFLAVFIGAIPVLKNLVFQEHAIFYFLSDSLNIMGGAMIPCIMLSLGGNLVSGAATSELGVRTTIAITATRLLIIPMGGLAVVSAADRFGFLPPDDKMFRFVLLLQHTMPTSILAGAVANLRGHAEKEASAVLFYEHVFAILSMADVKMTSQSLGGLQLSCPSVVFTGLVILRPLVDVIGIISGVKANYSVPME